MHDFHLHKRSGVYEIVQEGLLTIEDIRQHYSGLNALNISISPVKVLIDCSKAQFDIDISEVESVEAFRRSMVNHSHYLMEAMVVTQPYETAMMTLYTSLHSDLPNYSFEVFSTREAALAWLAGAYF